MQAQLGIKIGIIFVIALLILLPINMVKSKIVERQVYLNQAKEAVLESWTGPQLVMAPVIVIPYTLGVIRTESGFFTKASAQTKILMPKNLRVASAVENRHLRKGIYEIPVYVSRLQISASFSTEWLTGELARLKETPGVEAVQTPYVAFHISDVRGIESEPTLAIGGKQLEFAPGSRLRNLAAGMHAPISDLPTSDTELQLSISLALRGLESLVFVPLGNYADISVQSNWPHPEFIGASLPGERSITADGFQVQWRSTKYTNSNQGVFTNCIASEQCGPLLASASGVRFIEPVDIYLQSERSVKYAMLFIGLSFMCFFLFENIKKVRIHPIQYTFVGLAIAVFYLLLISLAEHLAFAIAYSIAVACCCGLMGFYVRYMFRSLVSSLVYSTMLVGLYGLLYVIIQAEDFALVMGAFLVFVVLGVAMIATRDMDWYEVGERKLRKRLAALVPSTLIFGGRRC